MSNENQTPVQIEVELEKMNKVGLAALCGKVGLAAHSKKAVMVNRLRYAISQGTLVSTFSEPDFDAELEAQNQPKPPKEKKVKAPKEPKPERVFNWSETAYENRQVYTPAGTGFITAEDSEQGYFQVKIGENLKAVKGSSVRFKAVNEEYRDKYIREENVRTESGAPAIHSGHNVSYALLGTTMAEIHSVAKENGLEAQYQSYVDRPKPLNPGMVRMNIGNILIGKLRKGEAVTIFGLADIELAAQRGQERSMKEAEAKKARAQALAKERGEAAAAKKAEKEQAKADAKAKKEAEKAEKAAAEPAEPKAKKPRKAKAEAAQAEAAE